MELDINSDLNIIIRLQNIKLLAVQKVIMSSTFEVLRLLKLRLSVVVLTTLKPCSAGFPDLASSHL
jgi:hypothetical protein